MRRLHKNSGDPPNFSDLGDDDTSRNQHTRFGLNPLKLMGCLVVCLMGLSVLFSISIILKDSTPNSIWAVADARVLDTATPEDLIQEGDGLGSIVKHKKNLHSVGFEHEDKLLGGLLSSRFDQDSCHSRYESASFRKESPYKPSSYLISRLRRYEALHKRCGPYTESYNRTVEKLKSNERIEEASDCNYLIWVSFSGLGNRILTLGSAFLYAILTDRVLLVDRGTDLDDLFCEPFPEVSWLLPLDFPIIDEFKSLNQKSPECFGNIISANSSTSSAYVYLHLVHDYDDNDKLFFCDQDQSFLQNVPWVIMKSDNYFIPSLFLMPSFEQQLLALFPDQETVFHFLGRYLFFPTNPIWGLITRYYKSYLQQADEIIGIQVRVFDTRPGPFQYVLDQILSCSLHNNLLPEINPNESSVPSSFDPSTNQNTKAVLLTSLSSGYFEKLRDMYWEHPTVTGEVIQVFQPSHEGYQQTGKKMHHRKAWAEMYLLSLSDKLITSSWSTFGYVAQSLGGLNPWILYKPENETTPNPACTRAMSIEPCFHAPPFFDCKKRTGIDTGEVVSHVRHCEDMSWGLKLVNPTGVSVA